MQSIPFTGSSFTEVALSVQFLKLANLRSLQSAELRKSFKDFSEVEEHPLIPQMIEQFEQAPFHKVELELNLPPPPRYLFVRKDKTELVQVQRDRFGYNWKHDGLKYPDFKAIEDTFANNLTLFTKFISDNQLGPWNPIQCDITYFSSLVHEEFWSKLSDANKILNLEVIDYEQGFDSTPEAVEHTERHIVYAEKQPIGRLFITIQPGIQPQSKTPVINLTFLVRGKPITPDMSGVMTFMELGKTKIEQAFSSSVRSEVQKYWRKTDGISSSY